MNKHFPGARRLLILLLPWLLVSCASNEPVPQETSEASAPPDTAAPAEVAPAPVEYAVAPFQQDSLYQLLVAEVAGYRGDYDTALEKYLAMAVQTRDAGVAARATRLAVYLKADAEALTAATLWAEVEPDSVDARRHAATQLVKAGDLEAAVEHMAAVKAMGGLANFDIFAYRANELDESERQTLLVTITRMLEDFPDDPQLLFSRAVLLERGGDYAAALVEAERLLAITQPINAVILKVNILKNLTRLDDAIAFLATRLTLGEDQRRLQLMNARLLFEANRLDEAQAQYETILLQAPRDGDILFALALIAMEKDEDTVARTYLESMLRLGQRVGEVHFYLGNIADKQNDVVTAIREYRQAGQGYEYLPAQSRVAALMIDQGLLATAQSHLANERAEHPDRHGQLVMVEAQLLSDRGLEEPLMALLDEQIAANPGNIDLLYYRAMSGQLFGRLDILERDLSRIIEMDPDNADALNALGYTLADQTERFDEALVLIERALAIKPDEAAFIDSLGWVYYKLGRLDEAVEQLRRALSLFPNDEVAAHLGEALWQRGDQDEARAVWNKALLETPESEILNRVIKQFTP